MRTPAENKSAAVPSTGDKCPQCGQRGTACRAVRLGHWCQTSGLIEDASLWIHPSPDPVAEAMEKDPAIIDSRVAVEEAQAAYEASQEAWLASVTALAAARIEGSRVSFADGGFLRRRRSARTEEELVEAERIAARERDRLHEDLVDVSSAHGRLLAETRRRMSDPASTS